MALISLQEVSMAFGGPLVLDKVSFQLEAGERVALLGRNGAGKTTLLKIMAGVASPDSGQVVHHKGVRVAFLPQEVPRDITGKVFDIVLSGLGSRAGLLAEHHRISHELETSHTPELMRALDRLHAEMDRTHSWELDHQVEEVISHMSLDPEKDFAYLSGGQKRRVLLARALVEKPEVLILDEPTNHLDIASIDWLEGLLKDYQGTVFFVTHDRVFMEHVTTRIMELDRGQLAGWSCDYKTFLERRQMQGAVEASSREHFEKKLGQEESWIRRGVEARRCRNEGRVKALEMMREEKRRQRQQEGRVNFRLQETDPSGHLVLKASRIGISYGDLCLVRDFSTNVMRGDKIGVIGPNGCGKTTFLRALLGKEKPSKGSVRFGTDLEIAYFDQLREALDEEKTVIENVCGMSDTVMVNGKPRHIIGYLEDFLFTRERARTPVKVLSGGERNRLLLARLFTRPSNVLVMDEPTNDLDIETLELLEQWLVDYSGTLLLVSHDRAFLNNVVTSTMVFEGQGEINEYPGGYDDWLAQRSPKVTAEAASVPAAVKKAPPSRTPKLSNRESRELFNLPTRIASLEIRQEELCMQLADPEFYKKDPAEINKARAESEDLGFQVAEAYKRWDELEKISGGVNE